MFGKTSFTRSATYSATTPTSRFQPGQSPRRRVKLSFTSLRKLKYLFRQARLQEAVENASLQDDSSSVLWLYDLPNPPQVFRIGLARRDDPQPQTPPTGSPVLGLSTNDLVDFFSAQTREEDSATSTPPTAFSLSSSALSTAPTSALTSGPPSPQSFEFHPDLIAINQRIAELEALAKQTEQEHAEYVKNAREMEVTLMTLEEEVVSAVDAIKAVNKKTSLEDEENLKCDIERSRQIHYREVAEAFVEDAKRTYKEGQKKYADLQARFETLQREREQQRIDLRNAVPPSEPWLEIISTAVTSNLLGAFAIGIGHIVGPLLFNAF
ncbi:hypothetical protein FS837_005192 [Tulasnella sp. UAMH 9824]|nr:hypothetical protein FS837_005192 [Tulasnella sp. UAMH 9824]